MAEEKKRKPLGGRKGDNPLYAPPEDGDQVPKPPPPPPPPPPPGGG